MKKKLLISCLLVLAMLLAACGGENAVSETSSEVVSTAVSDTVSAESIAESAAESVPAEDTEDGALEEALGTIEELEQELAQLKETLNSVNAELEALKGETFSGGVGQFRYAMMGDTVLVCIGLGKSSFEADYESVAVYCFGGELSAPLHTELAIPSTGGGTDANEECFYLQIVDESTAFLVVKGLHPEIMDTELLAVYRTTDGGKTWENRVETVTEVWDSVNVGLSNVHFWDKDKGIYCRDIDNPETLIERVRVTFDGGKTWKEIESLPISQEEQEMLLVKDCSYADGKYRIHLSRYGTQEDAGVYVSEDLLNWTKE